MKREEIFKKRSAGVMLPVFSLPGIYGIGSFGSEARRFVDSLAEARASLWQILPIGIAGDANSPYHAASVFGLDPLLIDPDTLAQKGLLTQEDLREATVPPADCIVYEKVRVAKDILLRRAFGNVGVKTLQAADWMKECARFLTLRRAFGGVPWTAWPEWASARAGAEWEAFVANLVIGGRCYREEYGYHLWCQTEADVQWSDLRRYANDRGIFIVGDMPIYCAEDSVDVWSEQSQFRLKPDAEGKTYVSGVPPDYFSATGQVWNNPLYDWTVARAEGYRWWRARLERNTALFDAVRIDHFRAFAGYFAVPKGAETAVDGHWEKGPGLDLFRAVGAVQGKCAVLAEDLGFIDAPVKELLAATGFPGMRVLQFGWDGAPDNEHLPSQVPQNCVAYCGTHDNATLIEWSESLPSSVREQIITTLNGTRRSSIPGLLLSALTECRASTAIFCMQDILRLGREGRMNIPGLAKGNWDWKLREDFCDSARDYLRCLIKQGKREK